MSDMTEFLLARIAEDQGRAIAARGWQTGSRHEGQPLDWSIHMDRWSPDRVLAECEAKREIVAMHRLDDGGGCAADDEWYPCPTIRAVAAVYADHPDYDKAWRL